MPNNQIWQKIQKGIFIIADIGKNFIQTKEEKSIEEYLENAKKLLREAKAAGANAVKFQTHNFEDEQINLKIVSPHFNGSDRYNWVKRITKATPLEFWQEIKKFSDKLGIIFFSTPMSRGAAMKLEKVGMPLWKIGSADILDFVLLDFVAKTGQPIIISSGMSTLEEIDKSINFLKKRTNKIALLHCVSRYPCPPESLNLGTIKFFKKRYDLPIGFSDHSLGYQSALASISMGATIIEKHFSLSRNFWGPDHKVSMIPAEFKEMVNGIKTKKRVNLINYGKEAKILQDEEAVLRPIFRKSLVAARNLDAGTRLTPEMIYAMRPQIYLKGLPSEKYETVLGRRIKRDLKKYEPINLEDLR